MRAAGKEGLNALPTGARPLGRAQRAAASATFFRKKMLSSQAATAAAPAALRPPLQHSRTFHSLTVQSVAAVTQASPSGVQLMPLTCPVCPTSRRRQRRAGTSHSLTC